MRQRKQVSATIIVLGVFVCIFAAIMMILGIGIQSFESSFSKRGLRKMYDSMDSDLLVRTDTTGLAALLEKSFGVKTKDVDYLVDLLREVSVDRTRYYITGKGEPIDVRMITKSVRKQMEKIQESTGIEISEADFFKFQGALEEINNYSKEWAELVLEKNEDLATCHKLASINWVMIFYGVTLSLFVLLFIMMMGSVDTAITFVGVTTTVSAVFGFLVGLIWAGFQAMATDQGIEIYEAVFGVMRSTAWTTSLLFLFVGIALIVGGRNIHRNYCMTKPLQGSIDSV